MHGQNLFKGIVPKARDMQINALIIRSADGIQQVRIIRIIAYVRREAGFIQIVLKVLHRYHNTRLSFQLLNKKSYLPAHHISSLCCSFYRLNCSFCRLNGSFCRLNCSFCRLNCSFFR